MARIRTIKPDFWTDEKIVELSHGARLLFIGLWSFADDDGRMEYSPKRLKMQIFPADTLDISELFGEIRREGLITVYVIDGKEYLQIVNFDKHQKVDKRSASKFPPPNDSAESHRIPPTEGNGREGNGRERKNAPIGASFSDFWQAYPLKKAKGAAEKAWKQLRPDQDLLAKILSALQQQTAERKRLVTAGQFVPEWKYPATWLRGRCWEDEPVTVAGEPVRHTPQEIAKQKHAEELRLANVDVRKYKLRPQMRGEPDDSFLARVKREVTDIIAGKVA